MAKGSGGSVLAFLGVIGATIALAVGLPLAAVKIADTGKPPQAHTAEFNQYVRETASRQASQELENGKYQLVDTATRLRDLEPGTAGWIATDSARLVQKADRFDRSWPAFLSADAKVSPQGPNAKATILVVRLRSDQQGSQYLLWHYAICENHALPQAVGSAKPRGFVAASYTQPDPIHPESCA